MKDKNLEKIVEQVKDQFGVSLQEKFMDQVENTQEILRFMCNTAMNWHNPEYDLWEIGKTLQHENKYDIPYKTELEVSAGLWFLIYNDKV